MNKCQLAPDGEPSCPGLAAAHCTESCDSGITIAAFPPQNDGAHHPSDGPSQLDRDHLAPSCEPQCPGLASAHCTESCPMRVDTLVNDADVFTKALNGAEMGLMVPRLCGYLNETR